MTKYEPTHLESIPPEFIVGLEDLIEHNKAGCPYTFKWLAYGRPCELGVSDCATYLQYGITTCPWSVFPTRSVFAMMHDLITQWKKYMGIHDNT